MRLLVERHIRGYFAAHKGVLPAAGLYDRVLREVERPLIALTLGATRGNQIKAAHLLGLNRNTLRKKIRELDIPVVRGIKIIRLSDTHPATPLRHRPRRDI